MLMLQTSHRDQMRVYGTLLGRSAMGFLFVFAGIGMLMTGPAGSVPYYESLGIPLAGLVVWLVVVVKIIAGSALILGYRVGLAAAVLILFTVGTIVFAHLNPNDMGLYKNLAIIGGLCYVIAYGAGDGWRLQR